MMIFRSSPYLKKIVYIITTQFLVISRAFNNQYDVNYNLLTGAFDSFSMCFYEQIRKNDHDHIIIRLYKSQLLEY